MNNCVTELKYFFAEIFVFCFLMENQDDIAYLLLVFYTLTSTKLIDSPLSIHVHVFHLTWNVCNYDDYHIHNISGQHRTIDYISYDID